ncbi:tyrosine-type recombinase/integrase [Streptomyces sp. NPDC102360]|uniref:tyrosine-type recombinase/integrase n=1 Tax=Streptomyces sp. NPDC102360 TaxID=3366160 RepID=UPI0037FD6850
MTSPRHASPGPSSTASAPAPQALIAPRQQSDASVADLAAALLTALTAAANHPAPHLPDAPTLGGYGARVIDLALAGLETTTRGAYHAAWRRHVLPALGTVPIDHLTAGMIDRTVQTWVTTGTKRSTIKNALAALARITRQATRDGWLTCQPQPLPGWQRLHYTGEDLLAEPRGLALPYYAALLRLAEALTRAAHDHYPGWGHAVTFAACTGARIGEISGVRVRDIDARTWIWTARRQTTPAPGGLADKHTKGKRARLIPIIEPLRTLITDRMTEVHGAPDARLFTGPLGGRVTTATLRRATHWDEVTRRLGYEHLRRHDLRHTALTWMADAGVPLHVLQQIAGHREITTTQLYLHPSIRHLATAGQSLADYLNSNCDPIPGIPTHW